MDPIVKFDEKVEGLPEGVTPEALNSESVQTHIKNVVEGILSRRVETEVSGLKNKNQELLDKLSSANDNLKKYDDVNLEEIDQLRELVKNNGDATERLKTLTAERDGIKESYESKLAEATKATQQTLAQLHQEQLTNQISAGIREFNAKNPAVAVQEGTEEWFLKEAGNVWKRNAEGNYLLMDGDRVVTGSDGNAMGYSEWINSLRDKPAFTPLFKTPVGGGAGGAGGGGGNSGGYSGSKSDLLDPTKAANVVGGMFPDLPEK